MNPEMNPMDPALERAVSEICDEPIDPAAIEAAAARVCATRKTRPAQPTARSVNEDLTPPPSLGTASGR